MKYSKILNPITKRLVNIKSKQGKKILENYINQNGGGMTIDEILRLLSGLSCSISLDLMVDPVIISLGITFEREQIEEWFSLGNRFCPFTKIPIISPIIIENTKTRECIIEFKKIILEELKNLEIQSLKSHDKDLYEKTQSILKQLEAHNEKFASWEQNRSKKREAEKIAVTMPRPNTLLNSLLASDNTRRDISVASSADTSVHAELSSPMPTDSTNRPLMFGTNVD